MNEGECTQNQMQNIFILSIFSLRMSITSAFIRTDLEFPEVACRSYVHISLLVFKGLCPDAVLLKEG